MAGEECDCVIDHMVDLLGPFRSFHVYHPDQHGSASIKSVLPALVGKDYSNLAIADGGMASLAYLTAMYAGVPNWGRPDPRPVATGVRSPRLVRP